MVWKIQFTKRAQSVLKRLDRETAAVFLTHFHALERNPYQGILLKGPFKGYFKYALRFKRVDYRVAYRLEKELFVILIIEIGARENFYKRLERML